MRDISIKKIRIVLASARARSFTKASVNENISQPAITNTIKDVEEAIGRDIFVKAGNVRKAELSEDGEEIVRVFEGIIYNYERQMENVLTHPSSGPIKRQKVVIQEELVEFMEPNYIDVVRESSRRKDLVVISDQLPAIVNDIAKRNLILAIVEGGGKTELADFVHLGTLNVPLCAVQARQNGGHSNRTIDNVWDQDPRQLIFFARVNREVRRFLHGRLQKNDHTLDDFFQCDSEKMYANLIINEHMVGVLPLATASRIFPKSQVEMIPLDEAEIQVPYGALLPWGTAHDINVRILRENPIQLII